MKYIESLREGERINEIYLCKVKQSALTKAGKPYDTLILQDKTGTLDAKIAKKYGKKVIAFAGNVSDDACVCNQNGIDAFFQIARGVTTLEAAMQTETAMKNMELAVEQVFRVL